MTSFSQDIDLWYNLNHSSLLTNYKYFKTNCIPKLSRHCFHNFVWRHKATAIIYTSVIGAECWQQPMRLFTNKIMTPLQSYLVVVGGWLLFQPSNLANKLIPWLLWWNYILNWIYPKVLNCLYNLEDRVIFRDPNEIDFINQYQFTNLSGTSKSL